MKGAVMTEEQTVESPAVETAGTTNTENIEILYNTETVEVLGDGQVVTGVKAKNNKTNESIEISCTGFFVAIGHVLIMSCDHETSLVITRHVLCS